MGLESWGCFFSALQKRKKQRMEKEATYLHPEDRDVAGAKTVEDLRLEMKKERARWLEEKEAIVCKTEKTVARYVEQTLTLYEQKEALNTETHRLNARIFDNALENERLKSEYNRSEANLAIVRRQIREPSGDRTLFLLKNDGTSDVIDTIPEFTIQDGDERKVFVLLSDFQSIASELQRLMGSDALNAKPTNETTCVRKRERILVE
jgi:hypothetical protein